MYEQKMDKTMYKFFQNSGYSSIIVMRRLLYDLELEENDVMQWHKQAGIITNNLKYIIYFIIPKISATKIMTWKCHVDEPIKGRYSMILLVPWIANTETLVPWSAPVARVHPRTADHC